MDKVYLLIEDDINSTWSTGHPVGFVLSEKEAKSWREKVKAYEYRNYETIELIKDW